MPVRKSKKRPLEGRGRKERYEVLYEGIKSDMKFLAERIGGLSEKVDARFSELQGDIYEFKDHMNGQFFLLDRTVKGLKEEVKINRKWILQNQKAIEKNGDAIEKNREAIEKNREAIEKNREAIGKNREAIEKNQQVIERVEVKLDKHDVLIMKHEERLAAS